MATMVLDDPGSYGRVVRDEDGLIVKVVETKAPGDATPAELAITEVNTGIYAFTGRPLIEALGQITADNAQGEYYLPDVLPLMGKTAAHVVDDPTLTLGVNDRVDLATVRAVAQRQINDELARNGVTIVHPDTTATSRGIQ